MPQTVNNVPTNPSSTNSHLGRCYQEASTSRWELRPLFQSFLENRPADTTRAVRERRLLVSWDLKAIHYFRRCLKTWIMDGIPGDAIGAFLVTVLYEQDFHLDYRLTMMVRDGQTQVHIARRVLAFYQIRDDTGEPLWDNLAIYPENYDPNSPAGQGRGATGSPAAATEDFRFRSSTTQPDDPGWPLFMSSLSDRHSGELAKELGNANEEGWPPSFTGVSEEEIPIIEAIQRFTLHKNDSSEHLPLLKPGTARNRHTSRTNSSQDESLSFPSARNLLPLPPISRLPSPASSDKGKTDLHSSPSFGAKPRVQLNKPIPPIPSLNYIPYYAIIDDQRPSSIPGLRRKAGIQDLRKARERDAS